MANVNFREALIETGIAKFQWGIVLFSFKYLGHVVLLLKIVTFLI